MRKPGIYIRPVGGRPTLAEFVAILRAIDEAIISGHGREDVCRIAAKRLPRSPDETIEALVDWRWKEVRENAA